MPASPEAVLPPAEALARMDAAALEETAEAFAEPHEDFLHGHCVLLALALHARLGGRLLAILETDVETERTALVHAVVEDPDGYCIDVKGRRSLPWLMQEFDAWEWWTEPLDATALLRLNYGRRRPPRAWVQRAERVADALVPLVAAQRRLDGVPHPAPRLAPAPEAPGAPGAGDHATPAEPPVPDPDPASDPAPPSARERAAAAFAAAVTAGQTRAGQRAEPIAVHFAEVADLVARAGGTDAERTAAQLHDIVEDTAVPLAEIAARFGDDVAALVDGLTDPPAFAGLPTAERKARQAARVATEPDGVKRVKIADQTSNLRSIAADPPVRWSPAKCRAYIAGARQIVDAARGVSPALERAFDAAYAAAVARHGAADPAGR